MSGEICPECGRDDDDFTRLCSKCWRCDNCLCECDTVCSARFDLEDDFTPDTDTPATWQQLAEEMRQIETLPQALAEVDRLRAENTALRKQVAGHCERIAAASEVIARNAERDALARLEAWQREKPDCRAYEVRQYKVLLAEDYLRAEAYRCPSEKNDYCSQRTNPAHVAVGGTDDKPATIAETILAALELWEELYGGNGGTA